MGRLCAVGKAVGSVGVLGEEGIIKGGVDVVLRMAACHAEAAEEEEEQRMQAVLVHSQGEGEGVVRLGQRVEGMRRGGKQCRSAERPHGRVPKLEASF
jgi:hypothetical protein